MKWLLIVACFIVSLAHAGDYITVTGSGNSFEEAKQQAFRKAIEFKVGATVLSDVETQNFNRVKDNIYVYSAAYVDTYKVLKQDQTQNGVVVLLDVKVSEGKLKSRILTAGKSTEQVDGAQNAATAATYIEERVSGDILVARAMQDYPTKAFKVTQYPHSIEVDNDRKLWLNVPYQLKWNQEFLRNMRETFRVVQDDENNFFRTKAFVGHIWVNGDGSSTEHLFYDLKKIELVHNFFVERRPKLVLRLKDMYNNMIYKDCFTPRFIWGGNKAFYGDGKYNLIVFEGNTTEEGTIQASVPLEIIDRTSKIELSFEPSTDENQCRY
jgi:hypothetical protein